MPNRLCPASQCRKPSLAYCSKEYTTSFSASCLTSLMKIAGKRGRKGCLRVMGFTSQVQASRAPGCMLEDQRAAKSRLLPVERPQCRREIKTKYGGAARAQMHSKAKQSTRGEIRATYGLATGHVVVRFCAMSLRLYLYTVTCRSLDCSMNLISYFLFAGVLTAHLAVATLNCIQQCCPSEAATEGVV